MTDYAPKTRWNDHYSCRFRVKRDETRSSEQKREIRQRAINIANHPTPNNIEGCATCPRGIQRKIKFNTGLVIVYKFIEPDITFQSFRYVADSEGITN